MFGGVIGELLFGVVDDFDTQAGAGGDVGEAVPDDDRFLEEAAAERVVVAL